MSICTMTLESVFFNSTQHVDILLEIPFQHDVKFEPIIPFQVI
jgi:hypothetical protein